MELTLEQFKKDFHSWCGFDLVATEKEDIIAELKTKQWDLECEINAQRKGLERDLNEIMPD